jgi:hypothetical protein
MPTPTSDRVHLAIAYETLLWSYNLLCRIRGLLAIGPEVREEVNDALTSVMRARVIVGARMSLLDDDAPTHEDTKTHQP